MGLDLVEEQELKAKRAPKLGLGHLPPTPPTRGEILKRQIEADWPHTIRAVRFPDAVSARAVREVEEVMRRRSGVGTHALLELIHEQRNEYEIRRRDQSWVFAMFGFMLATHSAPAALAAFHLIALLLLILFHQHQRTLQADMDQVWAVLEDECEQALREGRELRTLLQLSTGRSLKPPAPRGIRWRAAKHRLQEF